METNDWRLRNQIEYLYGEKIKKQTFVSSIPKIIALNDNIKAFSDHQHCSFCWHKFMENCGGMEDCSREGYCTMDKNIWICENCYNDFKNMFKWILVENE